MTKVTPFLMFDDQLEAAVEFYTATFPDSEIRNVARTGSDGPVASAEFVVGGQVFLGYNGGPYSSEPTRRRSPRDREAAHRAEQEGIATANPRAVTCRKCREAMPPTGSLSAPGEVGD